jgi:chromate reductase
MAQKTKILAFAGSTRTGSWNKKLVQAAAENLAGPDVEVTYIDLADYPLPLIESDSVSEKDLPESARKLKRLFAENDGFLISSPEYNGSYSGVLKNALDWISIRERDATTVYEPFHGKVAGLLSGSPGKSGGLRGLEKLRVLLSDLGVLVLPDIQAVGSVTTAFNEAGKLSDQKTSDAVHKLADKLVKTVKALAPAAA